MRNYVFENLMRYGVYTVSDGRMLDGHWDKGQPHGPAKVQIFFQNNDNFRVLQKIMDGVNFVVGVKGLYKIWGCDFG